MNTKNTIGNLFPRLGKIALLIGLGWVCAGPAFAQQVGTGAIYGRVYDADSSRYMPSAEVSVEGTAFATVTEQGGFYVLNGIPAGEATVVVSYAGYTTEKKIVTVTPGGQVAADFDLHLTPTGPVAPGVKGDRQGEKVILLEGLTVTTNRSGNARAFMEQKNAMTMSTVLASDSYGTVQDGNIAEFLRQAPGISVLEDDVTGEANEISLGGMDPQYTGVYMDGARMASGGGSGGFDESSRAFQFSQISINGIESIEIRRTVSADMEGDAPAGGISMKSKSAFDRKEAVLRYNAFLTANSYSMDLKRTPGADDGKSYKMQPGFNLTYSTPFNRNKMGLMIEAGAQTDFKETNRATNNINAGSWSAGNPFVDQVDYRNSQTQSERANASIRFDWKISPYAKTSLRLAHELRNTTSFNRNVTFNRQAANSGKDGLTPNESSLLVWTKDGASSGTDVLVLVDQSASYKTSNTETINATFDWKRYRFQFNAVATLSYAVTKTNPSHGKWFPRITMVGPANGKSKGDFWASRSDTDEMDWSYYLGNFASRTPAGDSAAWLADIQQYGQSSEAAILDYLPSNNKETIPTVKADLRWDAPTKFPLWLKTGFNARQSKRTAWQPTNSTGSALANHYQYIGPNNQDSQRGKSTGNYDARGTTSGSGSTDAQPLSSEYFRSSYSFDPHFGGNLASLNIPMFNQTLLYQEFQRSGIYSNENPDGWFYQTQDDQANARIAGYTGKRDLLETVAAGYLMGQARPWGGLIFEAGLRYEYTYQEANTLIPLTTKQVQALPDFGPGANPYSDAFVDTQYKKGARTKTTNTYSFLLPSGAVKYELTPNVIAHLGYSEGFGRLDVGKLAGNWKVNNSELTATAPNPNLEPDHFKTYSLALEYYFEPAGSFTFTYSYRMWDGAEYTAQEVNTEDFNSPDMRALIDQYGQETIVNFLNDSYRILTYKPSDRADRTMHTLEFAYRQRIPAIPGLQVDANFTYIDPNWRKTGASGAPKIASGGFSYTNRNLYFRVSANWRDRYFVKWSEDENPEESIDYNGKQGQSARLLLNAELTYRLTKGIFLYGTASNILNSPSTVWVYTPSVTREQNLQGVAFRFGVKNYF